MLRKWRLTLAGLATAAAMSVSAQAAPLGLPDAQRNLADQGSLVERTHGWHRYCDWGPVRYHRHVPGYGNVPCYRGGYYRPHLAAPRSRRLGPP